MTTRACGKQLHKQDLAILEEREHNSFVCDYHIALAYSSDRFFIQGCRLDNSNVHNLPPDTH